MERTAALWLPGFAGVMKAGGLGLASERPQEMPGPRAKQLGPGVVPQLTDMTHPYGETLCKLSAALQINATLRHGQTSL